MTTFAQEAENLASVCRELDDPELIKACDDLAVVARESDEVAERFYAAAGRVKTLLLGRVSS